MARWVSLCLVAAALGLVAARFAIRPERESWLVISAGPDDSVVVLDYTVANTGLFADQLTTRATLLRRDASPLAHRAIAGPATLDDAGVHGTLDGVEHDATGWNWRVEGDAMRVRGSARDAEAGCPPTVGHAVGILDMPDEAAGQGEGVSLDGAAIVARTHAVRNEAGAALYAVSRTGALALDPRGVCPGFLTVDGVPATGTPPWIAPDPDDDFDLDFGGHHLTVTLAKHPYVDDPAANTLLPERWLAFAAGYRLPRTTLRRVHVSVDGAVPWTGVLVLREALAPWTP